MAVRLAVVPALMLKGLEIRATGTGGGVWNVTFKRLSRVSASK